MAGIVVGVFTGGWVRAWEDDSCALNIATSKPSWQRAFSIWTGSLSARMSVSPSRQQDKTFHPASLCLRIYKYMYTLRPSGSELGTD